MLVLFNEMQISGRVFCNEFSQILSDIFHMYSIGLGVGGRVDIK